MWIIEKRPSGAWAPMVSGREEGRNDARSVSGINRSESSQCCRGNRRT